MSKGFNMGGMNRNQMMQQARKMQEQLLAAQLQITSIPTLMAFREGILVFNQAGALPAAALNQVIESVKGLDMEEVRSQLVPASEG